MKKYITGILIALSLVVGLVVYSAPAYAASPIDPAKTAVCDGVSGQTGGSCGKGSSVDLATIIKAILTVLSIVAGLLSVIMIVVAGFKYTTSRGEAAAIGSAKNTLTYAIVGLVVVVMAQFIVRFVLTSVK